MLPSSFLTPQKNDKFKTHPQKSRSTYIWGRSGGQKAIVITNRFDQWTASSSLIKRCLVLLTHRAFFSSSDLGYPLKI